MADYEIINILDKYQEKELEIERNYNIRKMELEKDYKSQKKANKIQLLNSLFIKEVDIKNKLKGLKNHLEGINQIRNILGENEDNKGIQELKEMLNENQVNIGSNDILLREEEDIQFQENNRMKQSGKEEIEEIENVGEEPKNNEFMKKKIDYPMAERKRKRSSSDNNN